MGVFGGLIDEHRRARDLTRFVVVVGDHLQQALFAGAGAAVAKERLVHGRRVDGDGRLLLRVGCEAAAVLVDVLVFRRLIELPDAVVAGRGLRDAEQRGEGE